LNKNFKNKGKISSDEVKQIIHNARSSPGLSAIPKIGKTAITRKRGGE
jgi:hypothetical protein